MAARKKTTKNKTSTESKLSFEEALEELESLVDAMENDQLPLEQLVANYEKGSKLMAHCQSVLESAQDRIELISLGNPEESRLDNESNSGDVESDSAPANESEDDDIRLF